MNRNPGNHIAALILGAALQAVSPIHAEPRPGGTLTMVQPIEPPALVSAVNSSTYVGTVSTKIFEGLVEYDDKFNPRPSLAESWEISPDGKRYTFRLRHGVKWHDGEPLTSADVEFSLMQVWKKVHGRGRTTFDKVISTATPDEHTLVFDLSDPSPTIMMALSSYESQVIPKHVYATADLATSPALTAPIGTGPFKFVDWQKGQYIRLARNPDYWDKGKPYLDEIVVKVIPDGAARAASLETGETLLGVFNPVALVDVGRLAKLPGLSVETAGYGLLSPMYLMEFNGGKKPFDDKRVRQAVAHAIDRNFIIKNIWFGFGTPATSPVPSSSRYHAADDLPQYAYDVEAARRLLDEASLRPAADGTRFSMTLDTLRDPETLRTAEYVRQALKRVGVHVELRNSDLGTFIRHVYSDYDFDATLNFFSLMSDPTLGVERLYISTNIRKGTPFANASQFRNEEVDRLFLQARVENDPTKRQEEFRRMEQIVQEELPLLDLFDMQFVTIANKTVKGYRASGEGPYASFKDIYIER